MVIRERNALQQLTVPSFFRCPISMDVMKSPVSLCTGVTYDRSSIQAWLDTGHNTCPATMQVLPSTDFVPNLTLSRLIHLWSDSLSPRSDPSAPTTYLPRISKQQVLQSINNIDKSAENCLDSLSKIADFAKYSEGNREFLASTDGFLPMMCRVLSNCDEIDVLESIMTNLDLVVSDNRIKEQLHRLIFRSERDLLSPFISVLQRGSSSSRIKSARVLESIAFNSDSKRKITENQCLLHELFLLANTENDSMAVESGLSLLIAVSISRPVQKELVRFGIVRTAGKILSGSETVVPVIEKILKLLEMVSACAEGRAAIGGDESCVASIVRRLMKVSRSATEHGVAVIWSVCYLSRDTAAQEVAMKNNGLTKALLVMQSDCSEGARQMCVELVKVFRVNSKSCLASYETNTTHIMPY